jgi:hypothetical protein
MYTFSVSVNAFSVEFPLACYQQAGRVWYVSGALQKTYTLFYPAPKFYRIRPRSVRIIHLISGASTIKPHAIVIDTAVT